MTDGTATAAKSTSDTTNTSSDLFHKRPCQNPTARLPDVVGDLYDHWFDAKIGERDKSSRRSLFRTALRISSLPVVLFLLVLVCSVPFIFAHSGDLLSAYGTATVDGIISPGEYGSCIGPITQGGYTYAICETNDEVNDYYAVRISDLTNDATDFAAFYFDDDNNGVVVSCGPGNQPPPQEDSIIAWGGGRFADGHQCHVVGGGLWTTSGEDLENVRAAVNFAPGEGYLYEWSHPLKSGDPNDYSLSLGSSVGWCFLYGDTSVGVTLQYPAGCYDGAKRGDASNYGLIQKRGPGPTTTRVIPTMTLAFSRTDWALSNPTLSPASPNVGDPVTFNVDLTALSTTLSYPQSVTVVARLDGTPVGGGTVSYPGPTGAVMTVHTTPPWTALAGTHTIMWQVSSGTADPNGANNQVSRTFTVGAPPTEFDFGLSISPTGQTVTPGGSTSYTVTVNLLSGATTTVALGLSGEPAGVTKTFSSSSGSPSFSSSLTLSIASSVTPGVYVMTVTGTGGGKTHSAETKLVISETKDFRIDASPPSQTVSQGQVTSYAVSVMGLNGFSSQVALSATGLPAGCDYVFSAPSGTPDFSSTLTVTLPSSVETGSFTVTITGSGGGFIRIAKVVLVITTATETQSRTETQTRTETHTQATTATTGPYDILQQNSMLLVTLLVIVIAALLALLLRRRSAAHPAPPPPPVKPCPKCGKPLTHVKQYDRWYCNSCKEYE